ncbi:MAG TPA: hypothetical protein VMT43_10860 [Acidimicrobiales bacterium]|nr:hypothetical protein [Acidimicrobiales bacterium]
MVVTPAFTHAVTLIIEPSGNVHAIAIPAGFIACVASKLPAAARAKVALVTSGDAVPGNVVVYVSRAGAACNRAFLTTSIARSMTDSSSGPSLTAAQAACAAPRAVAAVISLDPTKVSADTNDNAAERALFASVDGCAPFEPIVDASLRSNDPGITAAQLACIHSKSAIRTWSALAAAGSAGFTADLQAAAKACGLG